MRKSIKPIIKAPISRIKEKEEQIQPEVKQKRNIKEKSIKNEIDRKSDREKSVKPLVSSLQRSINSANLQ